MQKPQLPAGSGNRSEISTDICRLERRSEEMYSHLWNLEAGHEMFFQGSYVFVGFVVSHPLPHMGHHCPDLDNFETVAVRFYVTKVFVKDHEATQM